jgi:hypothetical protein
MRTLRLAVLLCLAALPAVAQTTQQRVRGTIKSFSEHTLTVDTREGDTVAIKLADPVTVGTFRRIAFSDIKPGSYVAVTSMPSPEGPPHAVDLRVFPESLRGVGEGHHEWDLAPGSMMTNATVSAEVNATAGHDVTLSYKGGDFTVRVPPDLPVLEPAPASVADLKPGAPVIIFATKAADGALSAARVTVGTNGIKPTM